MLKKLCYVIVITLGFVLNASGRVVLITGASGDIGLGIAKHFINKGDTVICQYFSNKQELGKLQQASPAQVHLIQADFSQPETIQAFWAEVLKCGDHIDIVINSAGVEQEELSLSDTQRILNINYLSQRVVCDHAIEHFIEQNKKGIIINLSSRAAYRGLPKGCLCRF
jgi:glucose 1-dehydrogenase